MTSPIFTFGFSFGMVSLSTTGRSYGAPPRWARELSASVPDRNISFSLLIRGIWGRDCDIVLGREFEQRFARNAHRFAVRHHLHGRPATRTESCADRRAFSAADDSADHGACDRASADARGALATAAFSRDVVGSRINGYDVAVDPDTGEFKRQF